MSKASLQIAIMAGGNSRRMGQNKALLTVGGVRIIERVIRVARAFAPDVTPIIVANTPEDYAYLELPTLTDSVLGTGAMGGIHAVLTHAVKNRVAWTLVLACDMPFVSVDLLRIMYGQAKYQTTDGQIIVPQVAGYTHMLHAFYQQSVLTQVTEALASQDFALRNLLARVPVKIISEATLKQHGIASHALMNCNTPDELEKARHIADRDI